MGGVARVRVDVMEGWMLLLWLCRVWWESDENTSTQRRRVEPLRKLWSRPPPSMSTPFWVTNNLMGTVAATDHFVHIVRRLQPRWHLALMIFS